MRSLKEITIEEAFAVLTIYHGSNYGAIEDWVLHDFKIEPEYGKILLLHKEDVDKWQENQSHPSIEFSYGFKDVVVLRSQRQLTLKKHHECIAYLKQQGFDLGF